MRPSYRRHLSTTGSDIGPIGIHPMGVRYKEVPLYSTAFQVLYFFHPLSICLEKILNHFKFYPIQMLWSHERTRRWIVFGASRFVRLVSNDKFNGPTKLIWFVETFLIVFSAYGLAYVVPQVSKCFSVINSYIFKDCE